VDNKPLVETVEDVELSEEELLTLFLLCMFMFVVDLIVVVRKSAFGDILGVREICQILGLLDSSLVIINDSC
jgi:hypothetical protein